MSVAIAYPPPDAGVLVYQSDKYSVRVQADSAYYILHRNGDGGNALVPLEEMEAMKPMDFDEDGSLVRSDAPIDNYLNDYFLDSLDRYFPKYIDPHDVRTSILNVD